MIKISIIIVGVAILTSCSNNSTEDNHTFKSEEFVNTLISEKFIESHKGIIVKAGNRGEDKIYIKTVDGETAYINNFEADAPEKLAFLKKINVQNSDQFISNSHEILKEMHRLKILSIIDDASLSNTYRIYTEYKDSLKSELDEDFEYKYVILFTEDINTIDKTKIVDLNEELIEILPNYYLYSSNFYSGYDKLH